METKQLTAENKAQLLFFCNMGMKNPWVIYVPAEILAAYNRCNIFNTNILG